MYHVFLSHSSADKLAVEQLALRLRDEVGLQPFLDKWHLVPGAPWQPALEQALAKSETTAVFFGPSGSGPWRNEELQLALVRAAQQRDDFRVIPVLLPGARPEQLGGFLGLRTWVDFREGLDSEAAFARLVAGIQGRAPAGDAFTLPDEPAPYRGLLAFDEAHAEYFFGRDADIERTLERLGRERFVAVVGASGSGKSSLVLGGVLPRAKRSGGLLGPGGRTWTMRPGNKPLRALADAIAAGEVSGAQRLSLSDSLYRRFLEHPDGLSTALGTLTADRSGPCVLVVDQLEELFTHAPEHEGAREVEPFVTNLRHATLDGGGSLRILATLRADFFDRCLGLAPLRELLQDRTLLLGSLGDEALREVILRPAQKVGAYLEKGLLSDILRDVSREPGALPLLEDALDQLWRARTGAWLTQAAYEASGGISKALQRRAQSCYEALRPEEREVERLLLVRLASLGEGREDTRRRVPRSKLVFPGIPEERVEHVLRVLSGPGARLIVVDQGSVEVAHEILIRKWVTLRKWLDEDRRELRVQRRLEEAAGEWNEKGRGAGYLYTGARLLDSEELFQRKPALINKLERQFLEASIQLRDQRQREEEEQAKRELEAARRLAEETEARRKSEAEGAAVARRAASRLRRLALGLLVASVALIAGSFVLYRQFQRAEEEKRVAENERRIAFSRELVLSARQSLREDPQRSLLLLQEAQRLAPVDTLGEQLNAWGLEPGLLVLRGHRAGLSHAVFSPEGARVLTVSEDRTVRLWEVTSGKSLAIFEGHSKRVISATFSPNGAHVLTASEDGTARLWEAASGKSLHTFQGFSDAVVSAMSKPDGVRIQLSSLAARFSPNGERILTASWDGTVRLWEVSSGRLVATLEGEFNAVEAWMRVTGSGSFQISSLAAAFSPDGARVLTASDDGTARLWEAASGNPLATLQGQSSPLMSAAFSPDGERVLTAYKSGTARLWDTASGNALATLQGHSVQVKSVAFSPDGEHILTVSVDGTAKLWKATSGKSLASFEEELGGVESARFSPNGEHVLTASWDGTVRLWEVSSGKLLAPVEGYSNTLESATFSPDGTRILTASDDGITRLWETSSGRSLAMLRGHLGRVESATFSPDGTRILTASDDGTARLWLVATSGKPLVMLQGITSSSKAAALSPNGERVLTASKDRTARLWEAASGKLLTTFRGHSRTVMSARFSPNGERVLTVSGDAARLWEAASGKPLTTFQGHSRTVMSATFSPNGERVLTASVDGTARLWEAASGKPLTTFQGDSLAVMSATFSPNGERVLTVSLGGALRLWEVSSGRLLTIFQGDSNAMKSATFSPDGERILTAFEDGNAKLWEATSGKTLSTLEGHSQAVMSVTFSPNGERVLTASSDRTAKLWEAASGKLLATFQGHSQAVMSATFSPNGELVLTASSDETARLWEASSGRLLAPLEGHTAAVVSATFSPDGSRVLTASLDGTARLWPSWRWDPEAFAKLDVGRTLTCEERRTFLHEELICPEESVSQPGPQE